MGLVQRRVEAAGISTVSLTMIPELTVGAGVPRVAAIGYPMSRPMGRPGDAAGQRQVLRAALQLLADARPPEALRYLPFEWPETVAQARGKLEEPPPIAALLKRKPWLLLDFLAGRIPEAEPSSSSTG